MTNESVASATAYLDPKKPSAIPLTFLGLTEDVGLEHDEVCERWLGPAGDHIYFFHKKDRDDWNAFAGGDVLARKGRDKGHAYMCITSASQFWQQVALHSFQETFKRAKRLVLNASLSDGREWTTQDYELVPLPDDKDRTQQRHMRSINQLSAPLHQASPIIDGGFDYRFSVKLALGIGSKLFGDDFVGSDYAMKLRSELWNANLLDRATGIKLKPYFSASEDDTTKNVLSVEGVWTLTLSKVQKSIVLAVNTPTGKDFGICLHPDWERCDLRMGYELLQGQTFLIAPKIRKMWGPINTTEIVAHNLKVERSNDVADALSLQTDPDELPSKENGI
ncbi:hypothetical protein [Phaeobacter inhibens]|uniref:hypothetical protein n=1 Tax=Phaeobacter inhibens TaxID=221822 RepID=UPI001FD011BA|nr:hypothetical protein [Phaeobacter inhibens]